MKRIMFFCLFLIGALISSANLKADDTGIAVHGFADVAAGTNSKNTPASQKVKQFSVGTLDLYLVPEFEGNVKGLLEIAFEVDQGTGGVILDVERVQAGYTWADNNTAWVGRFHTPFGIWNTSLHHGAQIQTAIHRPRFLGFEDAGGILPAHSVGVWFNGKQPIMGANKLSYDFYVTNGSKLVGDNGS